MQRITAFFRNVWTQICEGLVFAGGYPRPDNERQPRRRIGTFLVNLVLLPLGCLLALIVVMGRSREHQRPPQ